MHVYKCNRCHDVFDYEHVLEIRLKHCGSRKLWMHLCRKCATEVLSDNITSSALSSMISWMKP